MTERIRKIEDKSLFSTPVHLMGNTRLVKAVDGNALDLNGHDQWVEVYRQSNVEIESNELTLTMMSILEN